MQLRANFSISSSTTVPEDSTHFFAGSTSSYIALILTRPLSARGCYFAVVYEDEEEEEEPVDDVVGVDPEECIVLLPFSSLSAM
jgi:hypothetical protein